MSDGSVPIGKIFSIQLRLHYSWFFIFALITWTLAASYFPVTYPKWSLAMKVGAGLLTSFLYFSSVVIHELSHSLVAIREGTTIRSIKLFFLGGVSEMKSEPKSAGAEFRMAVAGPLSSLVLGGFFLVLHYALRTSEEAAAQFFTAVSYYIGTINVFLGIFNLLPGFPLDGGRVVRSIIWWRTGDIRKSTRIAAIIGRFIGYLFIVLGVFQVFTNHFINGIWLVLIGWFLENAASGSYSQMVVQETLKGRTAAEIMSQNCLVVPPSMTVEYFVNDLLLKSTQRCFPVGTGERTDGLITLSDVKAVPKEDWSNTSVGSAMTPIENIKSVPPDEDLRTVLQIMAENDVNQVPVMAGSQIVGMIARDNIVNFIHLRGQLNK